MIKEVKSNKKHYLNLLLLADEQESMIDKYIDSGTMYVLEENGVKAVCVVTDIGNGILEIKNLAVLPEYQKNGYGKRLISFIEHKYRERFSTLRVGTGDSPLTVPFYKKCGFKEYSRIKNFFTDYYAHPIFENGTQLIDMIILQKII